MPVHAGANMAAEMQPWMVHAACRGLPVSIWFPERGEPGARAREICAGCTCLSACRTFAVSDDAPTEGIVAGLTAIERRRLRAEMKRGDIRMSSAKPRRRRGPEVLLAPFPKITATATETAWTMTQLLAARATPD